jgi:hypothetical protein
MNLKSQDKLNKAARDLVTEIGQLEKQIEAHAAALKGQRALERRIVAHEATPIDRGAKDHEGIVWST